MTQFIARLENKVVIPSPNVQQHNFDRTQHTSPQLQYERIGEAESKFLPCFLMFSRPNWKLQYFVLTGRRFLYYFRKYFAFWLSRLFVANLFWDISATTSSPCLFQTKMRRDTHGYNLKAVLQHSPPYNFKKKTSALYIKYD